MLGICDTAISGHLGSELFLSAIAVGSVMLNVVFWIFGFLRGGTTGLTANALGAGDRQEVSRVFYRALFISLSAGLALIALQVPIFELLWHIAGSDDEVRVLVSEYFSLRIYSSPALLATMAISGWFVGMQSTFYPMVIAIVMNVLNIGASCFLVFGMQMGFAGVALGTMLSNWLGLVVAAICLLWFLKGQRLRCSIRELFRGPWLRYFSVNGNLFLRSFFIISVTMGVTAAGARLGNLTLAVNVIVMQFFQFFSFFMDGFAFSGEAIVGLRLGEGNGAMLRLSVKRLIQWALGTGIFFSVFYFFTTGTITELLTDSANVSEGVDNLRLWISLIPVISCWAFIFDGFYIGITDTFKMMISAMIGGFLFFMIIYSDQWSSGLGLTLNLQNEVIWSAFLTYLLARGIYLAAMWPASVNKKLHSLIAQNN